MVLTRRLRGSRHTISQGLHTFLVGVCLQQLFHRRQTARQRAIAEQKENIPLHQAIVAVLKPHLGQDAYGKAGALQP